GFFWVMYDALNYKSDYSDNTNRVAAFSYGGLYDSVNSLYYIEVENQPVNVVALLDINTNCINNLDFNTTLSLTNPYYDNNIQEYHSYIGSFPKSDQVIGGLRSYNGKLPLDYGTLDEPASVLTNSSTLFLGVYMSKRRSDVYTDPTISRLTLCDDKMNTLNSTTSIPAIDNGTWFKSMYPRLKIGDLNYNYILDSNDADILLRYLVKKQELSTLQLHIADLNKDGVISVIDLNKLNQMLPANEKSAFISSSQEIYNKMSSNEKVRYNNLFNEIGYKTITEYDTTKK
ncbi:MAG: dockerin type I repeat-containing protein, partial [Ruminococcus sp.]